MTCRGHLVASSVNPVAFMHVMTGLMWHGIQSSEAIKLQPPTCCQLLPCQSTLLEQIVLSMAAHLLNPPTVEQPCSTRSALL